MKKHLLKISFSLLSIFTFSLVFSQQPFTTSWSFATDSLSVSTGNVSSGGAYIDPSVFTRQRSYGVQGFRGMGATGKATSSCNLLFNSVGSTTPISPYVEFAMSPNSQYSASLDSISFTIKGDSMTTASMLIAAGYSVDGGTTFSVFNVYRNDTLVTPSPGNTGIYIYNGAILKFKAPSVLVNSGSSLKIRIVYWRNNASNTSGQRILISPINLTGTTTFTGTTTPVITVPPPTTLSGFSYVVGSGPSAEQSFSVSGTDLTSNISISAPTDYEVSLTSGTGFSSSASITPVGGIVASTSVYVRLKAGLSVATYNNELVNITSNGATGLSVVCNGRVINPPPVFTNPTPSVLSGFTYGEGNGPSRIQSFSFSGQNLTDTVKVSITTTNFEISLDSLTGYVSNTTGPLKILPVAGVLGNTKVYARLKAGLSASATAYLAKKVTIASTGATAVVDTLYGTVFAPSITVSSSSLSGFTYDLGSGPSAAQSFNVNASASVPVGIKAPANYEISLTNGSGYTDSLTLNPVNDSTVALTPVYVRLKAGLAVGNYNDSAMISSNGAASQFVVFSGYVTAPLTPTISSPTPNTLSGFTYSLGSGPSAEQSFSVGGSNLTSNITVTAPVGYGLSLTPGGTYNSTVTLTQSGGVVGATNIYVTLLSGLSINNYSGNISITSPGASDQSVAVTGSVTSVVLPPTLTGPIPTILTGFTYGVGNGPSRIQSFSFSGQNLSDTVRVSITTANFEISLDSLTGYVSNTTGPLKIVPTAGSLSTTKIYARLKAGLTSSASAYQAKKVTISSTGATSVADTLYGTVFTPSITTSRTTLSGFTYIVGSGPSPSQSFNVNASASVPVGIKAPANYEISLTNGSGYTDTLTLNPINDSTVAVTPVYVRLKSGLGVGNYNDSTILTSNGALSKSISLNGTVTSNAGGGSFTATWPFLTDTLPTLSANSNLTASGAIIDPTLFTRLRSYGVTGLKGMGTNGKTTTPTCNPLYNSAGATSPITPYMEMNLAPDLGYTASLNAFSFTVKGDSISSPSMVISAGYSVDGGQTFTGFDLSKNGTAIVPKPDTLGTSIATGDLLTFSAPSLSIAAGNSLKIRLIYWKNATGTTSGNRIIISPITINGTTSVSGPIIASPSPNILSGFTYAFGAGPSAEQSVSVGGANLTTDLVVTASSGFGVSLIAGGTYTSSVAISPTSGTVVSTPVYVKMLAGLPIGIQTGNLSITTTGTSSKSVSLNGTVTYTNPPLLIIPSPAILSGFTYGVGSGPSRIQSFTFSGQDLIDTVSISITTANFEISLDSLTGYISNTTGPIKIAPTAGTILPTKVYARLKAGLTASLTAYQAKKVTISSAGATSVIDTLYGTVFTPSITTSTASLSGFTYDLGSGPSPSQSFNVNASASVPVGVKATGNFEISLTNGSGYTDSLTLNPINDSTVALTPVYVRLKAGLAVGNYSDSAKVTSNGAVSQTVAFSGFVTLPNTPTISTPTSSSLSGFTYVAGGGPSFEQTFSVGGSNLNSDITVAAPLGYGVSLTPGGPYTSSISLPQTAGVVTSTTIYVTMVTGLTANTYSGNINITSNGALSQTVSVSGTVISGAGGSFTATWPFLTDTLPTLSANSNLTASGAIIDPTLFTRLRSYGVLGLTGMGTNGKTTTPTCSSLYNSAGATSPITPYMEMNLAPNVGFTASLNAFNFTVKGDSISSPSMVICAAYSVDGGQTFRGFGISKNGNSITPNPDTLGTPIATGDVLTFSAPSLTIASGNSLKIRLIYWKNASSTTSGNRIIISAININGTTAVSGPLITAPTPSSLSGFTYVEGAGPSAAQSFNVGGINLVSNITVTAPTGYGVSLTSSGSYTSSVTLNQSLGTVASTPVYVKMLSGLSVGVHPGSITISSPSATSKTVSLNGTVTYVNPPTLTIPSPSILTGFTYGVGNGPSRVQSFTFSGQNLVDTVSLSLTTAYFEISLDSLTGYVSNTTGPLKVAPTAGTLGTTKIYARLKGGLTASLTAYQAKKVTISSTGATSVVDTLYGTVFIPSITASTTTLTGFTYNVGSGPSASQSFNVNASASVPVGIKAPTNYEISLTNGSGYTDTLTLSPVNDSTVALTAIYVRLKAGLAVGTYNDSAIVSSNGAAYRAIILNGNVTIVNTNPYISAPTPSSLTGFTYISGAGPSIEQSFMVSGGNLTAGILVTAPTGYGVSLTPGGPYTSSVTISANAGSVASTSVYVILLSGLSVNTYAGNITLTSAGAPTQNVQISGSVADPCGFLLAAISDKTSSYNTVSNKYDVTFTISGTPDAIVTYQINGGAQRQVTLDLNTGTSLISLPNVTTSQTINLLSVTNGSCTRNNLNISSTVVINGSNIFVDGITVYPNPFNKSRGVNIHFENLNQGEYTLKMINTLGNIVYNRNVMVPQRNFTYGLTDLPKSLSAGQYYIIVENSYFKVRLVAPVFVY